MTFPKHIFKAYDIRGIYPDEINKKIAVKIGRALVEHIKKTNNKEKLTLVVSHDMRESSKPLKQAIIEGITMQGANVVDIGLASTPTLYFAVGYYRYDGGVQITASHNPAEFNGCKIVREEGIAIGKGSGMEDVREIVEKASFSKVLEHGLVERKDKVIEEEIKYALQYVDVDKIKPFTIVIDTGNGIGGPLMEELFKHLPCSLEKMYFELNGDFPNHEADPMKEENNEDLHKKVVEIGADLGIAFDGDADRLFFIDNTGRTVDPAIIRGILSQIFLREYPGATVCYDVRPGRITIDMIEESGGVPVVTKVGHALIKDKAKEVGAVFAGESSGHFFLKMPHGMFEAPGIMILKVLQELSEANKTLSEYTEPLYRYHHSGEINFIVEDKDAVFVRLKEQYGDHLKYDIDGLSFEYEDWWFNVRPSNTEDKVRLNLESKDEETMKKKVEEVSRVIKM